MATRTQTIQTFLNNNTHSDLAERYSFEMECQCNVAQDNGTRIEGDYKGKQWHGWTNGIETWKSFRIPWNARTEPEFVDSEVKFNFDAHIEGIGLTGWNWVQRQSLWVGFDFDAITGHSERHQRKLDEVQLQELEERIANIPWVTLRYSTSGIGRHLYVDLEPVHTKNHTEHAALARAVLGMLSGMTGYDFENKVDIVGGNMWFWHRKMRGTNGLEIIKKATSKLEAPVNWRDHVGVVTGKQKKFIPGFIKETLDDEIIDNFMETSVSHPRVPLDSVHMKLLDWLREHHLYSWWDQDNHMLVTHTAYLAKAFEEFSFRGIFQTLAQGEEWGSDINCFAFPTKRGGWSVRRYSQGVMEAPTWDQDGKGWTRCFYNVEPDFDIICRAYGGQLDDKGGYRFREAEMAMHVFRDLKIEMPLAAYATGRRCILKKLEDNKIAAYIDRVEQDNSNQMSEWIEDRKVWKKVFLTNNLRGNGANDIEIQNYDDNIRHLVNEKGENFGWVLRTGDGVWNKEPLEHMKVVLEAMGSNPKEAKQVLGACVIRSWKLVNRPFQPEYPESRCWNRDAAQLIYTPSQSEFRNFPSWSKILNHLGQNLNDPVAESNWAKDNGILTGADYLKCWIASLFKFPTEPLPYLFFYGEQDSGKSIFHEALSLLISNGVVKADHALINPSGFNAELEHAVLCIVEETDISSRKSESYNRIKEWVTAKEISVHRKMATPYSIVNTTHWVQMANDRKYCPVFPGDTRITVIAVDPLPNDVKIPKRELIPKLQKEAPDFLAEVMSLELPTSQDRMNIPVISTFEKVEAQEENMNLVELFIKEQCFHIPGQQILFKTFCERFYEWLPEREVSEWTKRRVGSSLPIDVKKGNRKGDNHIAIINLSFDSEAPEGVPYRLNSKGQIDV